MRSLLRPLNSPWVVVVITLAFYTSYLLVCMKKHNLMTASYFVHAGDVFCDPHRTPPNLYIIPHSDGYDGEFYYRFALSPFSERQTDFGIRVDAPAYRQQRIFLSLAAYAVSFGNPRRVGAALILVNLAALAGLGWLGAAYAQEKKRHALWGLMVSFNVGAIVTLSMDTTEILALFLALLALRFLDRRRYLAAALAFTCAMLTRETTLVLVASALAANAYAHLRARRTVDSALAGDNRDWGWAILCLPFAIYALWQTFLTRIWGHSPSSYSGQNLGLPFVGIWELLKRDGGFGGPSFIPLVFLQLFHIFATLMLTLGNLRSSAASQPVKLAWVIYAIFGVSYTYLVYLFDESYLRVLTDVFALSALILIAAPSRDRWYVLLSALAVDGYTAYHFVNYR